MTQEHYTKLKEIFSKYYNLSQINAVLSWDRQVMMPKKGFAMRQKQQIFLDSLSNDIITDSEVKELVADCDVSKLNELEKRNFSLMKNIILHKVVIPKGLQREFIKLGLETEFIWGEARHKNDFKSFNKPFKQLVKLIRQIATIKGEALKVTAYEALIDQCDPGRKEKDLDQLFAKLAQELPPLIARAIAKQGSTSEFLEHYPLDLQEKLGLQVIAKFGVDDSWCRADESLHPFSSSEPGDARITTRYYQDNFLSGLMAFIHEAGHALYDNNRPKRTIMEPIGQHGGMALHESQSLFWEMQIGRSAAFCRFLAPQICKIFNLSQQICNQETLFNKVNFVKKSYIRVEADEMTYPLHIIMRYQIEKQLIYGQIETDDLPQIWNSKLKTFLDLKAPELSQGCLQDIHWSGGIFGYFPTYSLGAIYAAQIAQKVKKLINNYEQLISKGDFKKIMTCLKDNIHSNAAINNADQTVKNFCGQGLNADIFLDYLKEKYL